MIQSFRDVATQAVFDGFQPRSLPAAILSSARRKLAYLDAAMSLDDLRVPPGNKLHALVGDRAGHHAIWVNGQYRICFKWTGAGPADVEIVDYH